MSGDTVKLKQATSKIMQTLTDKNLSTSNIKIFYLCFKK